MPLARQDKFIETLKDIQDKYPEYAHILQLLIKQLREGNAAAVQAKLQQLQDEDW